MLTFLLSTGPQDFTGALIIGGAVGAFIGLVFLTATSASEGVQRVLVGMLIGFVLMGAYQALTVGPEMGEGIRILQPEFTEPSGGGGNVLFNAALSIIQAGIAGGLVMIFTLSPFRALLGALAGVIIGTVSGAIAWGALDLLNMAVPTIIFGVFSFGLTLYFFELLPFSSG